LVLEAILPNGTGFTPMLISPANTTAAIIEPCAPGKKLWMARSQATPEGRAFVDYI